MSEQAPTVAAEARPLRTGRPDTPWEYRTLIRSFARSDLKARFKGTALGWLWSFVAPVATIAIYSVVFSVFIRIEPPPYGNGNPGNYAVWLVTGLVTWQFISQMILRGMPTLLGSGALLRKVYFPSFVPLLATGISAAIQSLIELGIVLLILAALMNIGWTWLLIPLWAAAVWVFAVATSYILAVMNVHWRDLQQIMGVVLQLLFFLSPIIFPITLVPERVGPIPARQLVELNPFAQFITAGRELMYNLTVPAPGQTAYMAGCVVAVVGVARWVNNRWGQDLGESV